MMEDYFARLSSCTASGEVRRNILVIHPIFLAVDEVRRCAGRGSYQYRDEYGLEPGVGTLGL